MTLPNVRPSLLNCMRRPRRCVNSPGHGRHLARGIDVPKATCSVEDCTRVVRAGGKCIVHHVPRRGFVSCRVEGCDGIARSNGLCSAHLRRRMRHGDPLAGGTPRKRGRVCSLDGCDQSHMALGYCKLHYDRLRLTGSTEVVWWPGLPRKAPSGEPWNKGTAPWCICENCGAQFQVRRHRAATRRFCSNACQGQWLSGPRHPRWVGGVGSPNQRDRKTNRYKAWRLAVFRRDNFTCVFCDVRGEYLHADHILSWARHPDVRFDVDNGRTLCVPCHKSTDSWGRG